MAKYSEPKDYMLGRKAYKAYFDGVGIEFNDLSHDFQMRWVNVARAVTGETKRLAPKKKWTIHPTVEKAGSGGATSQVDTIQDGVVIIPPNMKGEELLKHVPRKPSGRIDYSRIPHSDVRNRVRRASIARSKRLYREKIGK